MEKRKPRLTQDTREQLPLSFNKDRFHEINIEALPFGDYLVELWTGETWQQTPIVVERKSLNDLYGTMTSGYERFRKEMQRAKDNKIHMVLAIEETMTTVHAGCKYSQFSGDSMLKKLAMLEVRYDLEVRYFNGRREMSRWIEEIADALQRNYSSTSPSVSHIEESHSPLHGTQAGKSTQPTEPRSGEVSVSRPSASKTVSGEC